MSTVVSLPEKRNDLDLGTISEQPPEKRPKLDDSAMEMESDSKSKELESSKEAKSVDSNSSVGISSLYSRLVKIPYCEICHGNVGHKCWDCPDRSRGIGFGCPYCFGPCKKKDGDDDDGREHCSFEMIKHCVECGYMGDHWVDDCPFRRQPEVDESLTSDDDEVPF